MSMKRLLLVVALGLSVAHASACGSDARATDTCRRIESTRCERGPQCNTDFTQTYGDVGSCQRFYDVQCGRGVQAAVKEPSKSELETCIGLIKSSCDAYKEPGKFCPFLTANETPAVVDTGTPDTTPAPTDSADGG